MNSQSLMIYAIVRKRLYELLKPGLIDYFSDIHLKLYEACFVIKMRKLEITPEIIKNYIYADNTIKDREKKIIIDNFSEMITGNKYIDVLNIENLLEQEWYQKQFSVMNIMLTNKESTLEMKKNIISKTADIINRTQKVDDFKNIKDILKDIRNNPIEKKKFADALIYLEDDNLKKIFDNVIYPHMYCILAKPGDLKTTLLLNLILEFNNLNKKGILLSFEDSAKMAAYKLMAIMSGENKKQLIQDKYNIEIYDEAMIKFKNNIFVMDKMRTADEVYIDLYNKLSVGDYQWIAVDYLQCIKGEKYLGDYEKISNLDWKLFQLNKEFQIPVFRLTQAPKAQIQSKSLLGMGDEKGSGEISHNSRYSLSINKFNNDNEDYMLTRIINIYKTTFCVHRKLKVQFNGASGQLRSVEDYYE